MVLYDLQQAMKHIEPGPLMQDAKLSPYGEPMPTLIVETYGGNKTVKVTNRRRFVDGISILLPEMGEIKPGDKLTLKGHFDGDEPSGETWAMAMRSPRGHYNLVSQHIAPKGTFSMYYIIDKVDVPYPLHIHSNRWGDVAEPLMDFYLDSVTVTREDNIKIRKDSRQLVYNMETDDYMMGYRTGDILYPDPYNTLVHTGDAVCVVKRQGISNAVYLVNRQNDTDGIDIRLDLLGLMSGNSYNIHVVGRIESEAPPGTEIMLQLLPGFAWRDNHAVESYKEFTLGHTLTLMELETADTLRITTDANGKNVDFSIMSIEITTEGWKAFIF